MTDKPPFTRVVITEHGGAKITFLHKGYLITMKLASNRSQLKLALSMYVQLTGDTTYADESTATDDDFSRFAVRFGNDSVECFETIWAQHPKDILGYARWYSQKTLVRTYDGIVQKGVCGFITQENIGWQEMDYPMVEWHTKRKEETQ